jgi:subtilisin family serine protease
MFPPGFRRLAAACVLAATARGAALPDDPGPRLIVRFKDGTVPASLPLPPGSHISLPPRPPSPPDAPRRRPDYRPLEFHVVELPPGSDATAALAGLAGHPAVDYAELDGIGTGGETVPTDPDATSQWHHAAIRMPQAWDVTRGSPQVVLAVLDTGINASLPDFNGRLVAGYDFVNGDNNPADDHGHGSAVTAVAAGTGNNGEDTAGVDWHCRIMPLKVLNASNSGFYSVWAAAIDYAAANGADVINLSAGGATSSTTLTNAIHNAIDAGVIFVTITHNDGSGTIRYPGSLPQCITVGATGPAGVVSGFSNYGTATDLVAPGGIGGAGGSFATNIVTTNLNGTTNWFWGTSFAAPQVAGAATLIRGLKPGIRQAEMEAILCAAAIDGTGDSRDTPGPDIYHGHGLLDVPNALTLATAAPQVRRLPGGAVTLDWPAPANAAAKKPFAIEWSPDLLTWHPVDPAAPLAVAHGRAQWTDDGSLTGSTPGERRFYRSSIRR